VRDVAVSGFPPATQKLGAILLALERDTAQWALIHWKGKTEGRPRAHSLLADAMHEPIQ